MFGYVRLGLTESAVSDYCHDLSFAVYASVQAHLKKSLYFPGDYLAWDKVRHNACLLSRNRLKIFQEFCESDAGLNSLLSEWAVLTPEAGNEAFNAQDGLAFTWSRLWPYLASYVH